MLEAKIEEDAIVVEDDDMLQEQALPPLSSQRLTGNTYFDVQLTICKETNLDDQPEEVMIRRLIKFFQYNRKIEPGKEYFCPKRQADYTDGERLLENQIIIYGCDFKKLKLVKKEFQTNEAIRINPSNFKLIYPDRIAAWNALTKNAKDPASLVSKVQSEDSPLPTCWLEMNPYTFNNRTVQVLARFATDNEKDLEPKQEERFEIYRQCSNIYNEQQQRRREEEASKESLKREKIERVRQGNSDRLYNRFQHNSGRNWQKGRNNNPGANRENSRSRSRSNGKENNRMQNEGDVNDNASNYSFILGKEVQKISQAMGNVQIAEKQSVEINLDSSIVMNAGSGEQKNGYSWSGANGQTGNWSYSSYIKQQQEEEFARKKKIKPLAIEVITIEDQN